MTKRKVLLKALATSYYIAYFVALVASNPLAIAWCIGGTGVFAMHLSDLSNK